MRPPCLSVVVPTWNGLPLLRRHLPSLLAACREMDGEVVVCDDASSDGTAEDLPREFPSVRLVRRERNGGFACAANDGIAAALGGIVVLVNNDVEILPGCLPLLADALVREPSAFAAVPSLVRPRTSEEESGTRIRWRLGVLSTSIGTETGAPPDYACGAAMAVRRERIVALGGFDPLYAPFYWEDVDLSFRARRRGAVIALVENARALHDHGETIGPRFERREVARIYERNRLIFTWKNLLDPSLWRRHLAALPCKAAWDAVAYPAFLAGLRDALRLRRPILAARAIERSVARPVADRVLLRL